MHHHGLTGAQTTTLSNAKCTVRSLNNTPAPASNETESGSLKARSGCSATTSAIATDEHGQPGNAVTRCDVRSVRRAAHHARDLGSGDEWQFRLVLIEAARLQCVGKGHTGGIHIDEDGPLATRFVDVD